MPDHMSGSSDDDVLLTKVLQRSVTDREFRARLITQPESAIEEIIGVPVANLRKPVRVKFVEKDPDLDALVVLPDFVDREDVLSEAELEAVAGGDACWVSSCTLSIDICWTSYGGGGGFGGGGGGSTW